MRRGRLSRAVRRGVALGLALVALWGIWLTAGGLAGERLSALGERPGLAVALLSHALRTPSSRPQALNGWGRLLLDHVPLLAAGEERVLALRAAQGEGEDSSPPVPDPSDGDDESLPELQPPDQV